MTISRRLEVDLQVRQEGKEPLWHPKPLFFTTTFSPACCGRRGQPGVQTGPTGEQEVSVHCGTGVVLCHTRVLEATKAPGTCRVDGSMGLSCPRTQLGPAAAGPPPRLMFLAAVTRPTSLSSGGRTHLRKGYGINS